MKDKLLQKEGEASMLTTINKQVFILDATRFPIKYFNA